MLDLVIRPSLVLATLVSLVGCGDDDAAASRDAAPRRDGAPPAIDASAGPDGAAPDGATTPPPPPPEDGGGGVDSGGVTGSLSERHPGDEGIASDPAVLFHDDFEGGWGRWDAPDGDTAHLTIESDAATAHAGMRYLRSTVTTADLEADMYISSQTRVEHARVDSVWWRFHVRFPELAPNPHHWVRFAAGRDGWDSSGLANTVPSGDDGFWFDFDADVEDAFDFYVYWYRMRSGRCNDGSATPGCEGDQGTTYYYGNVFRPPAQTPFPRDRWFCVEVHARANDVGAQNGELAFWIDDVAVGDYRPGHPVGTWLRAQFHTGGCDFSACTAPVPFEGFDFRSSAEVGFKAFYLDAYYERDSNAERRREMEERGLVVSDANTILYDDVVIATERVGCRR